VTGTVVVVVVTGIVVVVVVVTGTVVVVVVTVVEVWGRAMVVVVTRGRAMVADAIVVEVGLTTEGTKAGMLTAMTLPSAMVALIRTV
jgi:hypothetical protein